MSKLEELGRRAVVRQADRQVTIDVEDFDLVYRAATQLGRFFLASQAIEAGVVDFDLNLEAVQELRAALAAIEPDVMEIVGWQAVSPK